MKPYIVDENGVVIDLNLARTIEDDEAVSQIEYGIGRVALTASKFEAEATEREDGRSYR